ncbi:MAG: GyrI-like domain-containing protein [Chthonomonadales bacterium]
MSLGVVETRIVEPKPALYVTRTTTAVGISDAIDVGFGECFAIHSRAGLTMTGPPFCRYRTWSKEGGTIECGITVLAVDVVDPPGEFGTLGGCTCAIVTLTGNYDGIMGAYQAIKDWAQSSNATLLDAPWDLYLTDPSKEPDNSKWITEIYWPIAEDGRAK